MKHRIVILGTPVSSGNRGVLALGASLVNLCKKRSEQVILLLGHKDNRPVSFRINGTPHPIPIVNCRLSPKAKVCDHLGWIILASLVYRFFPSSHLRQTLSRITPWISAIEQADLIGDIRGGDSFSDVYGLNRFLFGFIMAWTVILIKGEIVQFPQTYGPYKSRITRTLAGYLLNRSSVIIARDRQSRENAQNLVNHGKQILLCPDVAFSLEALVPNSLEFESQTGDSTVIEPLSIYACSIGININGLMYNGGYTRNNMFGLRMDYAHFMPELIKALLAEQDDDIWLIPHTYGPTGSVESDPEACRQVRLSLPATLQKRLRILTGEYDCHQIKGIIGQSDFFIGSRMHACIAALLQGVPCVGIAYSHKFAGVFETVDMADWVVDGRHTSNEQAVAIVLNLYRGRNKIKPSLKQASEKARKELNDVFSLLLSQQSQYGAQN